MTLAIDTRTNRVIGQVAYTYKTHSGVIQLLTRGGLYITVPRSSVRLEVVR